MGVEGVRVGVEGVRVGVEASWVGAGVEAFEASSTARLSPLENVAVVIPHARARARRDSRVCVSR